MLFCLFIILILVGFALVVLSSYLYHNTRWYDGEVLDIIGWVVVVLMIIAIAVSGFIILVQYTMADAQVALNQQIYESLTYQLENDLYENDNDLGKKQLYDEIQKWNKDLAYYQSIQDDFWLGIYYPNVFDQFKFIEYKT